MIAAALAAGAILQQSANAVPPTQYVAFGGQMSCAAWLADAGHRAIGEWWLLGFVSGANFGVPDHRVVGNSTDQFGVIGEVRLICQAEPSTTLIDATQRVYLRLRAQQR